MTAAPKIDTARAGGVRRRGHAAVKAAYRRVFASEDGQVVLLDLLVQSGVTAVQGPDATDATIRWATGRASLALFILSEAGYDNQAIAEAMISDGLGGQAYATEQTTPGVMLPGDPDGAEY